MSLKDSEFINDLLNNNELPTVPVETYIAQDTLIKSGLIIMVIIVITVLLIRVTKPEPDQK